jgi:hypothetical protein
MRVTAPLAAALLALAQTVTAAVNLELYPDTEDCTGRKIVVTTPGCHDIEIRGSAKVISGGTWGLANKGCKGFRGGVYEPVHGCFTTYPVWFSWEVLDS